MEEEKKRIVFDVGVNSNSESIFLQISEVANVNGEAMSIEYGVSGG